MNDPFANSSAKVSARYLKKRTLCDSFQSSFFQPVIARQPLVKFTHISKVFCQQLISLVWFIPLHIDVFEFVLIGQNSTRNLGFLKVSF